MPAKKIYLSTPGQRVLKITAGLLGGYLLSGSMHLLLYFIPSAGLPLLISGTFSLFICWVVFMVLAFLAKNGWKIWGWYLLGTLICLTVVFYLR